MQWQALAKDLVAGKVIHVFNLAALVTKMCMEEWKCSSTNFNLDTRWRWASYSRSCRFTPGETTPSNQCTWGWIAGSMWMQWRRDKSVSSAGKRTLALWLSSPQTSCYTALTCLWHYAKKFIHSLQYVVGWTKWYSTIMSPHQYRTTFIEKCHYQNGTLILTDCAWMSKIA
jgi:hypothetical protein